MKVELKNSFPLWNCSDAIRECHGTQKKRDSVTYENCNTSFEDSGVGFILDRQDFTSTGDKDKALIDRIGNKFKHASTLEHLSYTFQISGISRALLQELARHRMASLTVKSTRYTLSELSSEPDVFYGTSCGGFDMDFDENIVNKFIVMTSNDQVNMASIKALAEVQRLKRLNTPNDVLKFCLPESFKTSLTWTINARSLQNFISLRTANSALWEIRNLANAIYEELPEDHKYLFENFNHFLNLENAEH